MTFFPTSGGPTDGLQEVSGSIGITFYTTTYLPPSPVTQSFVVSEISYFQPAVESITFEVSTGALPTGAVSLEPFTVESLNQILVSDLGYISHPTDPIGQKVYEPILISGWQLDRTARIEPWSQAGSVSWGSLSIINPNGRYTSVIENSTSDGRPVTIKQGLKRYDGSRGIYLDPPYTQLNTIFSGVARGLWRQNENAIEIDIRDASYQGETPIQKNIYGGSGGYDGSSNVKGRLLPFCRGGTNANPIRNVSPILIDPVYNIWQYNDASGTIVELYERSAPVFTNAGDTTNLYVGTTSAGAFRTDNSRGLFQLGSPATGEITADVTGNFPTAGAQTTAANIARYILTETIGIDSSFIDTGSFIGLNVYAPLTAGIYLTDPTDAMGVVDFFLRSINAWLTPTHSGFLQTVVLRAPDTNLQSAAYTENQIIKCVPRTMPNLLTPPPYRIRVAHTKRNTVQTTNWSGSATEDRKQFVSEAWNFATWLSTSNLANYRTLNDSPPVETALLVESEAQLVVNALGDLFGVRRMLYDIDLPMYLASRHEIGETIMLSYPGVFANPTPSLVVGDNIDSNQAFFTLRVLV